MDFASKKNNIIPIYDVEFIIVNKLIKKVKVILIRKNITLK